jgi:hypothetical protein
MLKLASTLLTLILVLALSACGAQPSAPADAPAPAAANADTPDEAPEAEPEAESEVAPVGDRDPQDVVSAALDFERSAAIFEQFQSYRISVSNTQIVRSDGNVTETLSTYLEERINAPQIIRTVIGGGADAPANETQIRDGALYQIRADEERCEASVIDNDAMQMSVDMARSMMSMGFVFAAAGTPELVARGEEVNGIVTDHYRVTQDQNGVTVNGDFWVAAEGYLVKAESTSLIADPNGATNNGLETMFSYNLEVDQVAAIDLPSFCGDPTTLESAAIPLLDDARDQLMTDQFVGYVTDATPDEAIAFYTERLTAEGYTLNTLQESEYGAVLEALGPDRRLQISISNNTGVTGVSIMIEE